MPAVDDFAPSASLRTLKLRAELLRGVRDFFDRRGFFEVETPLLSADTVIDRHLDPVRVTLFCDPRRPEVGRAMWLQTSPEFGMKRLLAAGAEAVYQIAHAVRAGERGPWHNPEFTIVEWYRVGDGPDRAMQLLAELADVLLPFGLAERLSYREAFRRHAGVDPHTATGAELEDAARRRGVSVPEGMAADDRDAWLDLLLVHCVEPRLGERQPTMVYDYPASQAALAVVRDGRPPVAERFELYARGIELANGYHELLDPEELKRRNREANRKRAADGKRRLPERSRLLAAMEQGLPAASGVALGFDRLVALACGAKDIADVMAFPIHNA